MKTKAVEVGVGLFVIMGIAALLVLAVQVSDLRVNFKPAGYHLKAEFTNIGGLKVRSKVAIGGVVVGRVTAIQLDPKTYNARVEMTVESKDVVLPEDTKASILTAGLLGDNFVGLTPGFSETHLKEGSFIPLENTDSAIAWDQLVNRFVVNQAKKAPDHEKSH